MTTKGNRGMQMYLSGLPDKLKEEAEKENRIKDGTQVSGLGNCMNGGASF